jgi:hypothetical protein
MINYSRLVKVFLTTLTLSIFSQAFAQQATTQSEESLETSSHKKKKFKLEAIITSESIKSRTSSNVNGPSLKDINGAITKFDVSALYSLTPNDHFRLFTSVESLNQSETPDKTMWDLTEFMYRRSGVLTEASHGVLMNIELKNYYLMNEERREMYQYDGAFIPQLVFKKTFSRRLSGKLKLRRHFHYRNTSNETALRGENRVYLSGNAVFNRYVMSNLLFTYKHKQRGSSVVRNRGRATYTVSETDDILLVTPSLLFPINKTVMLQAYAESNIAGAHDGKTFREDIIQNHTSFGLAAYFTIL